MTDRTAEEWGRVAVSLPGFARLAGMRYEWMTSAGPTPPYSRILRGDIRSDCPRYVNPEDQDPIPGEWLDVEYPSTAGCLLELLGSSLRSVWRTGEHWSVLVNGAGVDLPAWFIGKTIGIACIAAAEKLGRWPGGDA
jgi:hypothetical protein